MLRNYMRKIVRCNRWSLYIISFIIICITVFFDKNNIVWMLALMYTIICYGVRIVYGMMYNSKVNSIKYDNKNVDYSECKNVCADNCGDIIIMISYIMIILGVNEKIGILYNNNNNNWIIGAIICYSLVYFIFATYSIKKDYIFFKICTLLCSTIQGVIMLVFMLAVPILLFVYGMEDKKMIITLNEKSFCSRVMILGYILEKYPLYTLIPLLVSIILYTVYVWMIPGFQLKKLEYAMQILNIIIVTIGIIMFFCSIYLSEYINKFKIDIVQANNWIHKLEAQEKLQMLTYLKKFGTTNIKNVAYLLALPYSGGILYANLIVKLKKEHIKNITNNILEKMLDKKINEKVETKKYFYYGGDRLKYKLCEKIRN